MRLRIRQVGSKIRKSKKCLLDNINNDDSETQYRYYNVDSITFSISPWLFKVSSAKVTDITDTSAKVEFNAWLNVEKAPYRVWPLEGVCFSEHNEISTTDDLIMSTYGFSAYDSWYVEKLEGLTPGTTYYLRPYVSLYLEPYTVRRVRLPLRAKSRQTPTRM